MFVLGLPDQLGMLSAAHSRPSAEATSVAVFFFSLILAQLLSDVIEAEAPSMG